MRTVVIIGNGSLAIGLSYYLKKGGYDPRFLSRDGGIEIVGYKLKTAEGLLPIHAAEPTTGEIASAALCFVTVKAFQLRLALLQHAPLLAENCSVIAIGNGAIDRDLRETSALLPKLRCRIGTTTLAISDLKKNGRLARLELTNAAPQIVFGPLDEGQTGPSPAEQSLIDSNPALFSWNPQIMIPFKKKWLFNTVLNSLCGVLKLTRNGLVLEHQHALLRAFAEAYALAEEHWEPWPESETAESLFDQFLDLVQATFNNENSMAKDIRLQRATESSYLAGISRGYDAYPFLQELDGRLRGEITTTLKMDDRMGDDTEWEPGTD